MDIPISFSSSCKTSHPIKNILIRHSCSNQIRFSNDTDQYPENLYILKYFPKYEKSLILQGSCRNALLSRVKRIKKVKRFTGYLKDNFQQSIRLHVLTNNQKEIEEIPQIYANKFHEGLSQAFLNRQKLKLFLNLKTLRITSPMTDFDNFGSLVQYIGNMKNLKSLKIILTDENYNWAMWVIEKVNKVPTLLHRLETLSLEAKTYGRDLEELFQNNDFLSHLTGLKLDVKFDPIICTIPETCQNLRSLSINFQFSLYHKSSGFVQFLTGIQSLAYLRNLEFTWPRYMKNFWSHFKPQPSIRSLKLQLETSDLIREGLFAENVDLLGHWEEIKELDTLEFSNSHFNDEQEIVLMKLFVTNVLKKINKLRSFKCSSRVGFSEDVSLEYEPFLVEEVPHLYEGLEKFEYSLAVWPLSGTPKFDLEIMKPFRTLKEFKLEGDGVAYENIHKAVSLLEKNQKEGEDLTFELKLTESNDPLSSDWLRETLMGIQKVKRRESCLKTTIEMAFKTGPFVDLLDELCDAIQSVNTVQGLVICLNFEDINDFSPLPVEEVKKVLNKYSAMRNIRVSLSNGTAGLEFIKLEKEKEQFFMKTY